MSTLRGTWLAIAAFAAACASACSSEPMEDAPGTAGVGGATAVSVGVGGATATTTSTTATTGAGGMMNPPPDPEQFVPCENASCWDTSAGVSACGFVAIDENFSSGNYNVHRYASTLGAGGETVIELDATAGSWTPALVVARQNGEIVFDGTIGLQSPALTVTVEDDGASSGVVRVRAVSNMAVPADIYVTSHEVIASDFADPMDQAITYTLRVDDVCAGEEPDDIIAPGGTLSGEATGNAGDNPIGIGSGDWGDPIRFDVPAQTHVGFRLEFSPGSAQVDMEVLRWDGAQAEALALTNGGDGERVMAVLDDAANRTYWVRARGAINAGTLVATYTPFVDGPQCQSDCAPLLQLPLPNVPLDDGYDESTDDHVFRYQFGRRDVLMFTRYAGRVVASAGMDPFTVEDLSKADGTRPPGHGSHTDGKDVDLSLYDETGVASWDHLCTATASAECVPGTDTGFDGVLNARKFAAYTQSGRVTLMFLDQEFHNKLLAGAQQLVDDGEITVFAYEELVDALQHWPNHHGHVHIRVSTAPY